MALCGLLGTVQFDNSTVDNTAAVQKYTGPSGVSEMCAVPTKVAWKTNTKLQGCVKCPAIPWHYSYVETSLQCEIQRNRCRHAKTNARRQPAVQATALHGLLQVCCVVTTHATPIGPRQRYANGCDEYSHESRRHCAIPAWTTGSSHWRTTCRLRLCAGEAVKVPVQVALLIVHLWYCARPGRIICLGIRTMCKTRRWENLCTIVHLDKKTSEWMWK